MSETYTSENIVLGERYRDTDTGFEGVATVVSFFQHGCERVTLKGMDREGRIVEYGFDAPEVSVVDPVRTAKAAPEQDWEKPRKKPGGPHGRDPVRR